MEGKVETYRRVDTLGKSQLDLILQVYDGALKSLNQARHNYEHEDFQAGYEDMERVKKFVTHLYTTLDLEKGGEVAANLSRLYAYVITQTYVVQATKDLEQLDSIGGVLRNLREGWAGLRETNAAQTTSEDTEPAEAPTEEHSFVTTA
jgi:flagellar protein FliS